MELDFPPNWDGPQPPRMTDDEVRRILEPLKKDIEIRKMYEEIVRIEQISFEVGQISYHRICGGGSMIVAPIDGDKSNHDGFELWCAKCGKIETVKNGTKYTWD
jgi:hypothetical protein